MRGRWLVLCLLVGACRIDGRLAAPDETELALRAVGPDDPRVRRDAEPRCAAALNAADAAFARAAFDDASRALDRAAEVCGEGSGLHWRRGLVALRTGDPNTAVRAFLAELRGPDPIPIAGVHLLEALPAADAHTRRVAKRRGKRLDPAGFAGLAKQRIAMARCGDRPATFGWVSCDRDPPVCTYHVRCEGGGRRDVAVGSAELWFGTQ